MSINTRRDFRKVHRWGAILIALPFLIVILSGLLLQVKKEFDWIQPPTQTGSQANSAPILPYSKILEIARADPDAGISGWQDIDRLDVRPDDGVIKIRSTNNWEIQVDAATGKVLSSTTRRSDVIEAIHDGSWFHDSAKLWIFLPAAVVVAILWITGIYLFFLPYFARWQNRRRLAERIKKRRNKKQQEKQTKVTAEETA